MSSTPETFAPDIRAEAERLAGAGARLPARLMGGLAIWLRCASVRSGPFARSYRDIDLVAPSRERKAVQAYLEACGYSGDRLFNALHGAQRLLYAADDLYTVDVIFDELNMSHRIDLRGRLADPSGTLDLADLLLTKLQVWEINEKDLGDALCILADHELGDGRRDGRTSDGAIDLGRIAGLLSADWGLCHTTERNLGRVAELAARSPRVGTHDVGEQVARVLASIDAAPKSIGWRTRARVGERVRWYETPEEVRR